jgi:two-component system cell cycle sensor histidine kinase/response regulator CckA
VERVRLLLLLPALATIALALAGIARAHESLPLRLGAALAGVVLAAHWALGYRRRRFRTALELPEALLVIAVVLGAPAGLPLPLFGTTFRALYRGPAVSALRVTAWMAGVLAIELARGNAQPDDFAGKLGGLLLAAFVMPMLVRTFKRLRGSEARLRAVLERSTDIITIVGADLRIRWQAASILRVLGLEPERLEGTPFLDLIHPDDVAAVERLLGEGAPVHGESGTVVARIADAGGSERELEVVAVNRLHDADVGGFLLSMRDVTERRRLERLRERVEAQRERQQHEARLQRSQRLESVGLLAGGVAHDFNNLLAAILNYASILREDTPPDSLAQDDLAEIEDAARRGARLVQQLLLFSQGKLTAPEVLDLNAVVQRLDSLLHRSVGNQVRLRYELDSDLAPVEADVTNLEQVLVNLVVNARDALGLKGGTVTVTTANEELEAAAATDLDVEPGWYVRLSVSDDGCGMDEPTRARALEPFFTTKPTGEGTGLGLATVHGIVSQAGGWLGIESSPGHGTTVDVRLPTG